MKIDVRWVSEKYAEMNVEEGGHTLYVGILNKDERTEIAEELRQAAFELTRD